MKSNKAGFIYLAFTITLFSTYEVYSRVIVDAINPFQLGFMRYLIGAVVLVIPLIFSREKFRIDRRNLIRTILLGILMVDIGMNLLQLALSMEGAKASLIALVFSSSPIFVAIFAVIFDNERMTASKVVGFLIGMSGIAVCSLMNLDTSGINVLSLLLSLVAAVVSALYFVLGRHVAIEIGSLKMNVYSFFAGCVVMLPFLLFFDIPVFTFDYSALPIVIYLGALVTGAAYLAYFSALSILGASRGSLIFFIKPVLASIFAVIILGETVSINLALGTILIILGISIVLYGGNMAEYIKKKIKSVSHQ